MPKSNLAMRGRQKATQKRSRFNSSDAQDTDPDTGENLNLDSHLNPSLTISRIVSPESGSEQKADFQLSLPRHFLGSRAERLLDLLTKVDRGELKKEDLGRTVRQSKAYRDTLHSTIRICTTKAMRLNADSPAEANDCLILVQRLNTIQELADDVTDKKIFHFLKLPPEVRYLIYGMAVQTDRVSIIHACDKHGSEFEPDRIEFGRFSDRKSNVSKANPALLQACRQIREEAAPVFYRQNIFAFPCTCALSEFFRKCNSQHVRELQHIIFNWWGSNRVHAMSSLQKIPLKRLEVGLNQFTTAVPTKREQMLRGHLVISSGSKPVRFVDSLGIEELLSLRGLEFIKLDSSKHLRRSKRLRLELEELQEMLEQILVLPPIPQGLS